MSLMKMTCVAVLWILVAAGQARADQNLTLTKSSRTVDHDCGKGGEVVIMGSKNQVALRGACAKVIVSGSKNTLRIEGADELVISGSNDTVEIAAVSSIGVTGHDNRVSYGRGLSAGSPKIASVGKNNAIQQVAALAGAAPSTGGAPKPADPPKPADAPKPGAGALREAKPILCQRNDSINLDGVIIQTSGVAITTQGNCRVSITNSKIVSTDGAAISTMGSTYVTLDGVEVVGKHGSVMNAGSADVTIKRSVLRGLLGVQGSSTVRVEGTHVHGGRSVTSSATYVDDGGNTFHKQ